MTRIEEFIVGLLLARGSLDTPTLRAEVSRLEGYEISLDRIREICAELREKGEIGSYQQGILNEEYFWRIAL